VNKPTDQLNRDRFVSELNKNFSVVAAAGSGKTRAITDRIVQIAKSGHARDWLPQLVVVAFTNRAADEMQQRARAEVLAARVPLETLSAFNRTFFGTIHSFSVRLLETYGHHLGLPPTFEVITDDDEVWAQFVQQQTTIGRSLSDENRRELLRHVQARSLMELGRRADLDVLDPPAGKCPDTDFAQIYNIRAAGAAVQTIPPLQKELKRVEHTWRETTGFVRWPSRSSDAQNFVVAWREAFAPLRRWIDQAALCVASEVQRDYRSYRVERGLLTYDDQIALALKLVQHPTIGRKIREKSFRIILDEAQDTDPRQFSLLLELARPPDATGEWLETKRDNPRPGHFCMVGDFQQSIYRDRADLSKYRRIHESLVETGAAEALKFSVTFRLDTAQLRFVNETFREILNSEDDQVAFVELNPRPEVLPGQVLRLDLEPANLRPDPRGKVTDARKAAEEARQLGEWLCRNGLEKLRAQSWRDVAILCPRKEWLQTLRRGLRAAGFNVQIQSEKEWKGDSPAYAWLTTLLIIMAQPRCSYEIAGLLRELFGISDHDLAVFAEGHGQRFQIETLTNGGDVVSKALSALAQIRLTIQGLPLFDAINEVVRRTALPERLGTLPSEDFEDLNGELDALLALAGSSEAQGMTIGEFAEHLRSHFSDAREVRPSRTDAIQLITSQKAKGSEWQAVIVPFLARKVWPAGFRYPRLIKDRTSNRPIVLLDKSDVTDEIEEMLERETRQEMERLLYVALTRARHTLVLVSDNELFAKRGDELHTHSQTKWLKAEKGAVNAAALANVGIESQPCELTTKRYATTSAKPSTQTSAPLPAENLDKPAAIRKASIFVRKLNPSGLAPDEVAAVEEARFIDDAPRSARPAGAALRYGLWWHDFVQRLNWTPDSCDRTKIFERYLQISPDPARSTREWKLLDSHLDSKHDFRKMISDNRIAHAEMPFLWRLDDSNAGDGRCLEGVIDLAVFNAANNQCLIIDWKTDRVPPDSTETLHDRYLPQLAAYWKAVTEMTKMEVAAAIYSTAAGALVRYERDELADQWNRIEKLQPDDLAVVLKSDARAPSSEPPSQKPTGKSTQLEFLDL
jgi:ATP-dependent exoDNAse (exonuclease V) beta subunit